MNVHTPKELSQHLDLHHSTIRVIADKIDDRLKNQNRDLHFSDTLSVLQNLIMIH